MTKHDSMLIYVDIGLKYKLIVAKIRIVVTELHKPAQRNYPRRRVIKLNDVGAQAQRFI